MDNKFNTDKYVLNLSEKMIDVIISHIEDAILESKIKQEEIDGVFKERESAFLEVKTQMDSFQKTIDEETHILEALIRYKTSDSKNKDIKVFKSLSNTVQKVKHHIQPKRPWRRRIVDTLDKEKKIYSKIVSETPEWKHTSDFYTKKFIKYYVLSGIRKGTFPDMALYKEKIGLSRWMDGEIPKAEYLKEFMFNQLHKQLV